MSNWRAVLTSDRLEISATLVTQRDAANVIRIIEFWKQERWPLAVSEVSEYIEREKKHGQT